MLSKKLKGISRFWAQAVLLQPSGSLVKSWRWSHWVKCFANAWKGSFMTCDYQASSMGEYTDHMRKYFPEKRVASIHQGSSHWRDHQSTEWELQCPNLPKKKCIIINESSKTWKPNGNVWGQGSSAQHSQGAQTWNGEEQNSLKGEKAHSLINFS